MRRSVLLSGIVLVLLAGQAAPQEKGGGVELQTVKYDAVKDAVLKNRGKVVLVDVWGFF